MTAYMQKMVWPGLLTGLLGALPAWAVEGPFTERVISTNAVNARSVFARDTYLRR